MDAFAQQEKLQQATLVVFADLDKAVKWLRIAEQHSKALQALYHGVTIAEAVELVDVANRYAAQIS